MKIHISYGFMKGPWGGGNQFLKNLRNYLISRDLYEEDPLKASVILFNSYPFREEWRFEDLLKLKQKRKITIIHRVDGPISTVRGDTKWLYIDAVIYKFNKLAVDGTIFQSNWSRALNKHLGMVSNQYETTILNGTDPTVFYPKKNFSLGKKVKLAASSWSKNWKKGFNVYQYLDKHLDFSNYEMHFIGNSPIIFNHIKHVEAVPPQKLAKHLRKHDLYIIASLDDPCSNSLIEAISVGLPAVAINSGGHREILEKTKAGILFNGKEDIIKQIDLLVKHYSEIVKKIRPLTIDEIGKQYVNFIEEVKSWKNITERDVYDFMNYLKQAIE